MHIIPSSIVEPEATAVTPEVRVEAPELTDASKVSAVSTDEPPHELGIAPSWTTGEVSRDGLIIEKILIFSFRGRRLHRNVVGHNLWISVSLSSTMSPKMAPMVCPTSLGRVLVSNKLTSTFNTLIT